MTPAGRRTSWAAVVLAAALLSCGAVAAETATPEAVYHAYAAALAAGDVDAAKALVQADAARMPLIDGRREAAAAERRFRDATEKAFPNAVRPIDYGPPTTRPHDAPDPIRVTVTRDTATVTAKDTQDVVRLRRIEGVWKIDLNAMYEPATVAEIERFRGALVEVMNALAAEVAAGRFKSLDDVQADLETRVKMRLATPDLPTTTRPAF